MEINSAVLDQIIALITSKITPERIVLFGSYASGANTEKSDIDILILIKNLVNERKISGALYRALLDENISIAVDFLAVDYDKYNILKNKNGYIYKTIEREGKIIYGK